MFVMDMIISLSLAFSCFSCITLCNDVVCEATCINLHKFCNTSIYVAVDRSVRAVEQWLMTRSNDSSSAVQHRCKLQLWNRLLCLCLVLWILFITGRIVSKDSQTYDLFRKGIKHSSYRNVAITLQVLLLP